MATKKKGKRKYTFTAARKRALAKARGAWKGMSSKKRAKAMPGGGNPHNKKKGATVAKRKNSPKKKKSNPHNPGRARRAVGRAYSRGSIMGMAIQGAMGVGGAIGGSFITQQLPIRDERLKAATPALIALVLGSTRFVQRSPELRAATMGLLVVGGLSLVRQFAPGLLLAGNGNYVAVPTDNEAAAIMGKTADFDPESMGIVEEFAGNGSSGFVSPADL